MFNPGHCTKCTKNYNNLSAKFAWIKKKVWAEKKFCQVVAVFWKTTENIFRQILFSRKRKFNFWCHLQFRETASHSEAEVFSPSRRIPSGVQSNSFSQFESQDSGSSDRWSVSMHRLWRLRSDREEPKSKSKRSPRGKKKLKELPLERQKKLFYHLSDEECI